MTRRWPARAIATLLCGLLAASVGCGQDAGSPPRPVERVDEISVFAEPHTAVNLDDDPEPDGIQMQVAFFQRPDRSVAVSGDVEVLLFNGLVQDRDVRRAKPMIVWSGKDLNGRVFRRYGILMHQLQLSWGDNVPDGGEHNSVTAVVRYTPPGGEPIWSRTATFNLPGR